MDQITVRLPEELIEELNAEAEAGNYDSRAELVRDVLESRHDTEELHTEIKRLRRERRQVLDQRQENQELVAFAESQQDLDRRQRERESANMFRRAWWFVAGRPEE